VSFGIVEVSNEIGKGEQGLRKWFKMYSVCLRGDWLIRRVDFIEKNRRGYRYNGGNLPKK